MIAVTPELLARHDRPGPRYTSYPTAVDFTDDYGPDTHREVLAEAAGRPGEPLSLYVHLPFCRARCSFCACHVVISGSEAVADSYLRRVMREAELTASALGERRRLVQYHWGGGTPTYHPPQTLARLHHNIMRHFELAPDAEVAIEVDPRVTEPAHLETLAGLGFNRLSVGVQDTDSDVQALIGRHQTVEQTESLIISGRVFGFDSINVDLIYGLPGQTEKSVANTLDTVIGLRPNRLAVYSFAHVPWMRPHQRRIDPTTIPGSAERLVLLAMVIERLTAAGYVHIGMDHFALPDDELALAVAAGTLTRTFMGYTTAGDTEVVALGTSGISDLAGGYGQGHRRLASYYEMVDAGVLPIERGITTTPDDRVRRFVINELMCNGRVRWPQVRARFGIEPTQYFTAEIAALTTMGELVEVGPEVVEATPVGRLFVRRLAAVFDAYTGRRSSVGFSRVV